MEHNFDMPSIQEYQKQIVGEINKQIKALNDQSDKLKDKITEKTKAKEAAEKEANERSFCKW